MNQDGIPEDHKANIIGTGLEFLRAITECYGAEKGMELWEQISSVLDPNVKGEMFFAMLTGEYNDVVTIKGIGASASLQAVQSIKTIRQVSGLGLKEAKDMYDRLRAGYDGYRTANPEKIKVDPKEYANTITTLRTAGFMV
jgi:hypothetical protein